MAASKRVWFNIGMVGDGEVDAYDEGTEGDEVDEEPDAPNPRKRKMVVKSEDQAAQDVAASAARKLKAVKAARKAKATVKAAPAAPKTKAATKAALRVTPKAVGRVKREPTDEDR